MSPDALVTKNHTYPEPTPNPTATACQREPAASLRKIARASASGRCQIPPLTRRRGEALLEDAGAEIGKKRVKKALAGEMWKTAPGSGRADPRAEQGTHRPASILQFQVKLDRVNADPGQLALTPTTTRCFPGVASH
jgi:hypothetical protein